MEISSNCDIKCFFFHVPLLTERKGPDICSICLDNNGECWPVERTLVSHLVLHVSLIFSLCFVLQWWKNEYISWDPDQFCGIKSVSVPTEIMWKPDITIEEM